MANLLVTGGAGFIGGNFVRYWSQRHPDDEIVVLDALTYAGNLSTIAGVDNVELVVGNICDTPLVEDLLRERDIATIVHFAAETHVDRSILGPDVFLETNVTGTHSLLKAARTIWLDEGSGRPHRFHHVSTDEVYGSLEADDAPFTEARGYAPNSPYSASKAASDHLVRAYHRTFGLETTMTLCSNNFGAYQYPEKLIPLFALNAFEGKPLPLYGDGRHVRDWLHVEDHCRAIALCLARGQPGEVFNIGGGSELPNTSVVEFLCDEIDRLFDLDDSLAQRFPDAPAAKGAATSSLLVPVEDRKGHDRRYAIDSTKAREQIGYEPETSFEEGLADTLRWYIANEDWWRPLRER